jgi:ABC-2 type transport system ATP-binding protein
LLAEGASVRADGEGLLSVTGIDAERVGELALRHRIALVELSTRRASLEEAFMKLTSKSVEYTAGDDR